MPWQIVFSYMKAIYINFWEINNSQKKAQTRKILKKEKVPLLNSLKREDEKNKARHRVPLESVHEVSERIDTYSQTCWSCLTYCSSKVFLYSEKSSSLLPWCAEWWGCGRWWTVSLWTTGSPLCSVSASLRFVVHLFCASSLCKTEATLLFIVHLTRCSWMQLGMCNAFEVVFCVLCSQASTNSSFFGKDVMHFVFCRVLSSFAKWTLKKNCYFALGLLHGFA